MSADEEREPTSSADQDDPLAEKTQPMQVDLRPSEDRDPASADTTTLGTALPPPIVVEEVDEIEARTLALDVSRPGQSAARAADTLAPSSSLRPMLLERVQPSLGRGERLRLDASHWRVSLGRAEESDIRLYTASASRRHATIEGDAAGQWLLTPAEGKSVLVDGEPVSEPTVLEVGMNLVLGQDHLRCVTEGLASGEMAARTAADGLGEREAASLRILRRLTSRPGFFVGLVGLVCLLALAWLVFARQGW